MTPTVEQLVRQGYEAWNEDDLDRLLELADEDIVFQTSGAFPDLETEYRGHDGVRRYWDTVRQPFEHLRIDVERVIEAGDDILVLFRFRAKSCDGLVTSIVAYPDWSSAAAAVGLSLHEIQGS